MLYILFILVIAFRFDKGMDCNKYKFITHDQIVKTANAFYMSL
jgi:hypothetical protein